MKFKRTKRTSMVGRRIVYLNLARSAPLGYANPVRYSVGSCKPHSVFWHAESQAKMGGPSHWTPLVRGPILHLLASANLSRRTYIAPRKCKLWQVLGSTMNIYVGCQKAKLHVMVRCFYNHNFFII